MKNATIRSTSFSLTVICVGSVTTCLHLFQQLIEWNRPGLIPAYHPGIILPVHHAKVLVLGITFKEDCPDIRNSRAIDIIRELQSYSVDVDVFDPWALKDEVNHEYNLDLINKENDIVEKYDAVILAVSHKEFKTLNLKN